MDQVRALISGLLNGGGPWQARWGWSGSRRSVREIWSAVAVVGLIALFRRPVPVPVRGRRRGRLG